MRSVPLARRVTINTDNKTEATPGNSLPRRYDSGHLGTRYLVWDLPTRLFHWLLALCLTFSLITAKAGFDWTEIHFLLGYCSLTLIVFRLVWGVTGTTHARFREFAKGPATVLRALPKLFSRTPADSVGHNPIGGWSTILFIALVTLQAGTGLFISDDIFYAGPYNGAVSSALAGTLAGIHHTNALILQIIVIVHLLAILWYALGKRTNLVGPMITGKKSLSDAESADAITSSQLPKALLIIALAALLVTLLVQLAPPPPVDDYF